jgi:hypothetical protein
MTLIRNIRRRGISPIDVADKLQSVTKSEKKENGKKADVEEDDDEILNMVSKIQKQAMKLKLQMQIFDNMGITGGGDRSQKNVNVKEEIRDDIKEYLSENGEKGEKLSTSEMMNMIIMLKALGEKGTDWKEISAIVTLLKGQEGKKEEEMSTMDIITKLQEREEKVRADERSVAEKYAIQQPQSLGDSLEDIIGAEGAAALKEKVSATIKDAFNPDRQLTDAKGKLDPLAVADRFVKQIPDILKAVRSQIPPKETEQFEAVPETETETATAGQQGQPVEEAVQTVVAEDQPLPITSSGM